MRRGIARHFTLLALITLVFIPLALTSLEYPLRSSPRCARTLTDVQDYVLSVAISPDGQWVVSGSKDRSIQFWNIASGQAQFMLQGHKNSVISIDLARSGGYLASGSGDCQARIWKYDPL